MIDLYEEFKSLTNSLEKHGVEYALCGGLAMAVHGLPRATVDIDLLIESKSLEEIRTVAANCGYSITGLAMSFAGGSIEMRRFTKIDPESGTVLPLDLILVTPAVAGAWESRERVQWQEGSFWVVSRAGLIAMKSLRGSGQDQDDISLLQEAEA